MRLVGSTQETDHDPFRSMEICFIFRTGIRIRDLSEWIPYKLQIAIRLRKIHPLEMKSISNNTKKIRSLQKWMGLLQKHIKLHICSIPYQIIHKTTKDKVTTNNSENWIAHLSLLFSSYLSSLMYEAQLLGMWLKEQRCVDKMIPNIRNSRQTPVAAILSSCRHFFTVRVGLTVDWRMSVFPEISQLCHV